MRPGLGPDVRWIVACSGQGYQFRLGQTVVRPNHSLPPGIPNHRANLHAALTLVDEDEAVIFLDDDDWYSPDYIGLLQAHLARADLTFPNLFRVYNLIHSCHTTWKKRPALLGGMGLTSSLVPYLRAAVAPDTWDHNCSIESDLWVLLPQGTRIHKRRRVPVSNVGMKGVPGWQGHSREHFPEGDTRHIWTYDLDQRDLRTWIGPDVAVYRHLRAT